jgi:hypothetical protein
LGNDEERKPGIIHVDSSNEIPDWKTYDEEFNVWVEAHGLHFYDQKLVGAELPREITDVATAALIQNKYVITEQNSDLEDVFVYVVGHVSAEFDGQSLEKLFLDLAGVKKEENGDLTKLEKSVLTPDYRLAYNTVFGQRNLWKTDFADLYDSIGLIRRPCLIRGVNLVEGGENIQAIKKSVVAKQRAEHLKRLIQEKTGGKRELPKKYEGLRTEFTDVLTTLYRLVHERAINTLVPIVENFTATRTPEQKMIYLMHPFYLRRNSFMDGLRASGAKYVTAVLPRRECESYKR